MPSIFISSTFKDLQDERNFFINKISAEINKFTLKNYGDNYYFRDLRLGVENIEEDFQTINACLYYLKNDAPPNPYIAIIGDNLGWVPKKETIEDAINNLSDENGDLKKVLNDVLEESSGKSITNIEIDYAAFGKGDPGNSEKYKKRTLFIFKSKEEHGDPSLKRLKDDIKKEFPDSIIYMDDYENPLENKKFKNAVLKKMKTIIKKANNGKLSGVVKERKIHENYMELKASAFHGRTEVIKEIKSSIEKNDGYTYIYGESGIGKSSLVSKIAKYYKDINKFIVFPIYCGLTPDSDSAFNIITAITNYLNEYLPKKQKSVGLGAKDVLEEYKRVCYLYDENPDTPAVLIVIDAIDQLKPDKFKEECAFLSYNGHKKIRFLFSGTESGDDIKKSYKGFRELDKNQNFYLHEIKGIDETEKEALLKSIFANELDKGQLLNAVVKKVAEYKISSPLYLKLIALRIANLTPTEMKELGSTGGHRSEKYVEIVDRFLNSIEETENEGDKQLENLVKAFFKSICEGKNDLYSVLQYIALSRHGLPQSVIKAIDKDFDMSQFEFLQCSLRGVFFEHNDGCIDFTHKIFRNTLRKEIENKKEHHKVILEVLKDEKTHIDFVKTEYTYHAFLAGDKRKLNGHIKKNTPSEEDLEEDRKIKEERLDYVAMTLIEFPVESLLDFAKNARGEYRVPFVDFCFDKLIYKSSLHLEDEKYCDTICTRINSHYYEKISDMLDPKVKNCFSDFKKADNYLNSCLYYVQNVRKYLDFVVLRKNQNVFAIDDNRRAYDFLERLFGWLGFNDFHELLFSVEDLNEKKFDDSNECFEQILSIMGEPLLSLIECFFDEQKNKIKNVIFKMLCEGSKLDKIYYWDEDEHIFSKKCVELEEYNALKESVSIEECSPKELVVYYDNFMDKIFDFLEPQDLIGEYNSALNFLKNYINSYDYFYQAISAIKKCFDSIKKNKERGRLNFEDIDMYICDKYIETAVFLVEHYNSKVDVSSNEIEHVRALFSGIPDCFENESNLKRKWAELSYKFIERTYVDFSHSYSQVPGAPILVKDLSFFEKSGFLFEQEGYEDLVEKLSKCAITTINNFFCYYEKHRFFFDETLKGKILPSLKNDGVGDYLNIETIYKGFSENDKKHILNSFNSLLQYKDEYEEEIRNNGYGIKWNWKRPAPES